MSVHLPKLHVEGSHDVSLISALLKRHGVDTRSGAAHLQIKAAGSVEKVLDLMPDAVKATPSQPVGFVIDIDLELTRRWQVTLPPLR